MKLIFFKTFFIEFFDFDKEGPNSLIVWGDDDVFVIEDDFKGSNFLVFFEDENLLFFELFFPLFVIVAVFADLKIEFRFDLIYFLFQFGNKFFEVKDMMVFLADFDEGILFLVFELLNDFLEFLDFVLEVDLLLLGVLVVFGFEVFDFKFVVILFLDKSFD